MRWIGLGFCPDDLVRSLGAVARSRDAATESGLRQEPHLPRQLAPRRGLGEIDVVQKFRNRKCLPSHLAAIFLYRQRFYTNSNEAGRRPTWAATPPALSLFPADWTPRISLQFTWSVTAARHPATSTTKISRFPIKSFQLLTALVMDVHHQSLAVHHASCQRPRILQGSGLRQPSHPRSAALQEDSPLFYRSLRPRLPSSQPADFDRLDNTLLSASPTIQYPN